MKKLFALLLPLFLFGCQQKSIEKQDLTSFLPKSAVVIVQTPNLKEFFTDLQKPEIFSKNNKIFDGRLSQKLSFLKEIDSTGPALLSFSRNSEGKYDYLLITRTSSERLDSIKGLTAEKLELKGQPSKKLAWKKNDFFATRLQDISLLSSSRSLLEKILTDEGRLKNANFDRVYSVADRKKASVFINHDFAPDVFSSLFSGKEFPLLKEFAGWSMVDLDLSPDSVKLNGIAIPGDQKKAIQNIFSQTGLSQNQIAEVTPVSAEGFSSYSFQDFESLQKNLLKYREDSIALPQPQILASASEFGLIYLDEKLSFVVNSIDTTATRLALASQQEIAEEFHGTKIFKFDQSNRYREGLQPLLSIDNLQFYTLLDHFFIFSQDLGAIEKIIAAFQTKNTLREQEYYQQSIGKLSAQASMLFVANTSEFVPAFASSGSEELKQKLANFKLGRNKLAALQVIQQDDFAHLHAIIDQASSSALSTHEVSQVLSVELEHPLATQPFLFQNHRNDQKDIAVQDEGNILYLISNKGDIYWKKQLSGRISGDIHQVDLFRNGRYQLAFTTDHSLEIIDRDGNTVKPFPVKFKDRITQPLAVFDYDHNRKYRFVVTQNNQLFMINGDGKSVKGFGFDKAGSEIVQPPKHIRIANKDYILVPEASGKLNILSRRGSSRITVKGKFEFGENEWYENKNHFLSSDPAGDLIRIDQNGKVNREKLNLAENNKINATEDLLVSLNENILKINGKEFELDFGLYAQPQIFSENGEKYIAITDLQAQRVYVFNEKAELLPGFPVYGTSQIDLGNVDIDQRMEFAVRGEENEILLYKL